MGLYVTIFYFRLFLDYHAVVTLFVCTCLAMFCWCVCYILFYSVRACACVCVATAWQQTCWFLKASILYTWWWPLRTKPVVLCNEKRRRRWSGNINLPTKFHKDGEELEHKVRTHSATGCCSISSWVFSYCFAVVTSEVEQLDMT
jgi:hypothetical protein